MAKSFRCRDAGVVCNYKATGSSEEEVLEKAVAHARKVHHVDLTEAQTLARYAHSAIRDDSGRSEGGDS